MKIFLVLFFLLAGTLCFAQQVNNQLQFQKGQKLEMEIRIQSLLSQSMGDVKLDGTINRTFDVENVSDGNATIEHKIKRVVMHLESSMLGTQSFDSEKESDMKSDIGKNMEKTIKSKYTMTVDRTGKVASVKSEDEKKDSTSAGMNPFAGIMDQIAKGFEAPKTGDVTDFKILPDKGVTRGETWTDSTQTGKSTYTVSEITDSEIVIDYKEKARINRKQEAMGMEINITSDDSTTGKITIDRKSGLLKSKTSDTDSQGKMEMMGQSIPTTNKITRTITVKGF